MKKKNHKQLRSFQRKTFPELAELACSLIPWAPARKLYALYLDNPAATRRQITAAIGGRMRTVVLAREVLRVAGMIAVDEVASRATPVVTVLPPPLSRPWCHPNPEVAWRMIWGEVFSPPTTVVVGPDDPYALDVDAILRDFRPTKKERDEAARRAEFRQKFGRHWMTWADFSKNALDDMGAQEQGGSSGRMSSSGHGANQRKRLETKGINAVCEGVEFSPIKPEGLSRLQQIESRYYNKKTTSSVGFPYQDKSKRSSRLVPLVLSHIFPSSGAPLSYRLLWIAATAGMPVARLPRQLWFGVVPRGELWQAMAAWVAETPYWDQAWAALLWAARQEHIGLPDIFIGARPLAQFWAGHDLHSYASIWPDDSWQSRAPIRIDMAVDAPGQYLTADEAWLLAHLPDLGIRHVTLPLTFGQLEVLRGAMPSLVADTMEFGEDWKQVMLEYIAPQIRQLAGPKPWKNRPEWEPTLWWLLERGWDAALGESYVPASGVADDKVAVSRMSPTISG